MQLSICRARATGTDRGRKGDVVVYTHKHAGLRWKVDFLAFASNDVCGASSQAESESSRHVAEDQSNQRAAPRANRSSHHIASVVVLFFDDLALIDFYILAPPAIPLAAGLFDGDDAHVNGNKTAIDFQGAESQVHVG